MLGPTGMLSHFPIPELPECSDPFQPKIIVALYQLQRRLFASRLTGAPVRGTSCSYAAAYYIYNDRSDYLPGNSYYNMISEIHVVKDNNEYNK